MKSKRNVQKRAGCRILGKSRRKVRKPAFLFLNQTSHKSMYITAAPSNTQEVTKMELM